MSVRRLNPVQPASFSFTPDNISRAKRAIVKFPPGKQASAVIQLLWFAQEQDGWVSRAALEYVGRMLDMAYIRVLEVATFYTMFQLSPVGRKAHIQVCGTTPCMLRGAEDLIDVCKRKIHPDPQHLSADGALSWEEVECLGACVNAPMIQVVKDTYEDLTPQSLEKMIDDFAAGRPVKAGPQNGRQFSMALSGATSLTDKSLYNKQQTFKRVEAPPPAPAPAPVSAGKPTQSPHVGVAPVSSAATATPATLKPPQQVIATPVTPPTAPTPPTSLAPPPAAIPANVMAKPTVAPSAPELLKKPREGRGDDLQLIDGIGPVLEKLLHKTGVWHFDQIASWSAADIAHIDELMKGFHGRIKRDQWVRQAKKLVNKAGKP